MMKGCALLAVVVVFAVIVLVVISTAMACGSTAPWLCDL
jgi:hypothetical protein